MSAPTGIDATALELVEHRALVTAERLARLAQEREAEAVYELERDLEHARGELKTANGVLEAAEQESEQ